MLLTIGGKKYVWLVVFLTIFTLTTIQGFYAWLGVKEINYGYHFNIYISPFNGYSFSFMWYMFSHCECGGTRGIRTPDQRLKRTLLYRLSYGPTLETIDYFILWAPA